VTGPSWKHRRRLIYATYVLAVMMIAFAMAVYRSDTSVASQLIVGAVSLISIILTAYTAFATLDDKWHWTPDNTNTGTDTERIPDEV
jgi:disulfide bond formation protein DsbB